MLEPRLATYVPSHGDMSCWYDERSEGRVSGSGALDSCYDRSTLAGENR